jgi:hypothetical protein
MKVERFKYIVTEIEALCLNEGEIIRKKTTTTSGSSTWCRYMKQIEDLRQKRLALWEELRQAIYGAETGR